MFTVSGVNRQVKSLLEGRFSAVWVEGEISGLRLQSSGHCYFTLKDASSQLSCALFRGQAAGARDLLEDGLKILVNGELTLYEMRGQYQLIVHKVEPLGQGALQLKFEHLKRKLQGEGLFDPARKKPLPRFPVRVAVVTSLDGAAFRDVLHVVRRRNPSMGIVLVPCRVQGETAAREMAMAIERLNAWNPGAGKNGVGLILLTRGGGSLEDLWAFNEEALARSVSESVLPVVSAVGHEIDFLITDFVADLRAATPSAAAEILTGEAVTACEFLEKVHRDLSRLALRKTADFNRGLEVLRLRVTRAHPRRRLNEKLQHLDTLKSEILRSARFRQRRLADRWRGARQRLTALRPSRVVALRREQLAGGHAHLSERVFHQLDLRRRHLADLRTRLRLLSPEAVLARGYSITTDLETGVVLREAKQVHPGQILRTRLEKGVVVSAVAGNAAEGEK